MPTRASLEAALQALRPIPLKPVYGCATKALFHCLWLIRGGLRNGQVQLAHRTALGPGGALR
jgi:hypothetical protein